MADRPRHFEADIPYVHSTMNNISLAGLKSESRRVFAKIDLDTKLQPLKQIKERNRQVSHQNTLQVLRSLISENQPELVKYVENLERSVTVLSTASDKGTSTFTRDPSSTDTKIIMNYSSPKYKSINKTEYDDFIKDILNVQKYVKMYAPILKDPKYRSVLDELVAGRSSQYVEAVTLLDNLFNLFDKNDMDGAITIKGEQLIVDKEKWDNFIAEKRKFYVIPKIRGLLNEIEIYFNLKLNEKIKDIDKNDSMFEHLDAYLLQGKQIVSKVELAETGAKYIDISFVMEKTGDKIAAQIKTRNRNESPYGIQYTESYKNGNLKRKFIAGEKSYNYKTTLGHGLTSEQAVVLANLYNLAYGEKLKSIHIKEYPVEDLENLFNYQLIRFTIQNASIKELPSLLFINNEPMWTYDYFIMYWKYVLKNDEDCKSFIKLNKTIRNNNIDLYRTKLAFLKTTTKKLTEYGRVKKKYKGKKGFEDQRYEYNNTFDFKRTFAENQKNKDMLNSIKDLSFQHALLTYPNQAIKRRVKRA